MKSAYTFHCSVLGATHIICQDWSDSYSDPDGRYHIAVEADGHGDPRCFRSKTGSHMAVEAAMENLRALADQITASPEAEQAYSSQLLDGGRSRRTALRRLTDTILAQWTERVIEHYNAEPPQREELPEDKRKNFEDYVSGCWEDAGKPRLYGTTLMAALMTDRFLLLIHQGDGRCDVFYEDGTVDQPIPWDSLCLEERTTSMCDPNAADSFRSCVVDLSKKPVMACFLGSDGVEDSFRDTYADLGGAHSLMGGVHTFYKALNCKLAEMPAEQFEAYLQQFLPRFSAAGCFESHKASGDDVSVAGIANVQQLKRWVRPFEMDIRRYVLEERAIHAEEPVTSMTRKHGILQRRFTEAAAKIDEVRRQIQEQEDKIDSKRLQLEQLQGRAAQARQDMQQEIEESDKVIADKPSLFVKLLGWSDIDPETFSKGVSRRRKRLEDNCRQLEERAAACKEQLGQLCDGKTALEKTLDETIAAAKEARNTYEEYHARFEQARQARAAVQAELDALPARPGPADAEPEAAETETAEPEAAEAETAEAETAESEAAEPETSEA